MLVLTGIELVADMGVCFVLVTKTLLATQGYFNNLHSVKDLSVSRPIIQDTKLEKEVGRKGLDGVCLLRSLLHVMEPCFPEDG